jgi:tetratricopeptide (TPR) repeat protein
MPSFLPMAKTAMAKPGRNDPCPCGSGKKYKRCCLEKDEAAQRKLAPATTGAVASPLSRPSLKLSGLAAEMAARLAAAYEGDDTEDELTAASNAAVDLVHDGKLDEAEQVARDLIARFPDVHDGWDRLGMVYEARADWHQAAGCYRKAIEVIRAHPESYDPSFEAIFHKLVDKLDPPAVS